VQGFGSDVSAVAPAGSTICDLADELGDNALGWSSAETRDPVAFGVTELTDGLEAVRDAWRAEFDVYVDVLSRWCVAMRQSAGNYRAADAAAAARLSGGPTLGVGPM
jgi:hypothetical protein